MDPEWEWIGNESRSGMRVDPEWMLIQYHVTTQLPEVGWEEGDVLTRFVVRGVGEFVDDLYTGLEIFPVELTAWVRELVTKYLIQYEIFN